MNKKRALALAASLGAICMFTGCGEAQRGESQPAQEPASQESHRDFGDYRVHFNALSTDLLAPEVASAYGIVRSRNRAMLNISIMRRGDANARTAVRGKISVKASNLTGQLKNVTLREISEGDGRDKAIYYIGELSVADGETLIFDVAVTPAGESSSYQLRFQRQFFTG